MNLQPAKSKSSSVGMFASVLFAVLILFLVCFWIPKQNSIAKKEKGIAEKIIAEGGSVVRSRKGLLRLNMISGVVLRSIDQELCSSFWRINELQGLSALSFYGGSISENAVAEIAKCRRLEGIGFHKCSVSPDLLQDLLHRIEFKHLLLSDESFGDKHIERLKMNSKELVSLVLADTSVSDSGLESIVRLPSLKILQLTRNNSVTENGYGALLLIDSLTQIEISCEIDLTDLLNHLKVLKHLEKVVYYGPILETDLKVTTGDFDLWINHRRYVPEIGRD